MAGCSVILTFVCQEVIFPSICLFSCLFIHLHAQLYVNFTVLQIRRGIRDNLGMIFHITSLKRVL